MCTNFNPRSPCGERPRRRSSASKTFRDFNPRSPCGERPDLGYDDLLELDISIHAPHAGSDSVVDQPQLYLQKFQSTLLMRGATIPPYFHSSLFLISIHAPHAGSDSGYADVYGGEAAISIHAPHAGSDSCTTSAPPSAGSFQSTLPMRGATMASEEAKIIANISIHAPHAGSDPPAEFNNSRDKISIHAPHAGSDLSIYLMATTPTEKFQSTLPMRGATRLPTPGRRA